MLAACDFFSIELLVKGKLIRCMVLFAMDLSTRIFSSENQLRYVLSEHLGYYHHERIRQGVGRIIEPKYKDRSGEIVCIERLGGLLKSSHPAKSPTD